MVSEDLDLLFFEEGCIVGDEVKEVEGSVLGDKVTSNNILTDKVCNLDLFRTAEKVIVVVIP